MKLTHFEGPSRIELSQRAVGSLATILSGLFLLASPALLHCADVIILKGAAGTDEYAKRFNSTIESWQQASAQHKVTICESLETFRSAVSPLGKSPEPVWIIFVGHGTSDARDSHFNLVGPDLSASALAELLKPFSREIVLIDTTAASGPFIKAMSGANRVIVTATKGADEVYFTRFGQFFAEAIAGQVNADLDQDKQVSVLESFLFASRETRNFYEKENRIATEHALLDDNGDAEGTRSEAFSGLHANAAKEGSIADGERARQLHLKLAPEERSLTPDLRKRRDALEAQVRALVDRRTTLAEDDYYRQLEALFVEIAKITKSSFSEPKP